MRAAMCSQTVWTVTWSLYMLVMVIEYGLRAYLLKMWSSASAGCGLKRM